MVKVRYVNCPRCSAQIAWTPENRYRPFCSERCKLFDLGAWATEKYRVPDNSEKNGVEDEDDAG
jgi:endogenous inhibitor of DNA gyrase (YacG/DUF329 family)